MKRTPLKRKTRLRFRSERAVSYADELNALKPRIDAREAYRCAICRIRPIYHYHHKLRRAQGGKNTMANVIGLCDHCHFHVHEYPAQSYEMGWLTRRTND